MLNSVYTDGDGVKIEILKNQVSQSTTSWYEFIATNAIDGTRNGASTNEGVGEWWKVEFGQEYLFTKIRIQSTDAEFMQEVDVMVSGTLVESLSLIQNNTWYEISCNQTGSEIKLVTTLASSSIELSMIEVYDTVATASVENAISVMTTNQQWPTIFTKKDFGFVAAWSQEYDDDKGGPFKRHFNNEGVPVAEEVMVSTTNATHTITNSYPRIAKFSDESYVITWTDWVGLDGEAGGVFFQRYDESGNKAGSETQVNTYTTSDQIKSKVDVFSDKSFIIVWVSLGQDGEGGGIYGQRFNSTGDADGTEFVVNTYTTGVQDEPSVSVLSNDNFVITWHSLDQDGDLYGVIAALYDISGNAIGSEFVVNTYTTDKQAWPVIAARDDGGFVIAYQSEQDGSDYGINAQIFDSSAAKVGDEIRVNTFTSGTQNRPVIRIMSYNRFIILWDSEGQDGDGKGVYAQRFISDGTKEGSEYLINDTTAKDNYIKEVAIFDNSKGYVVSYTNVQDDDDGTHLIYYMRFDDDDVLKENETDIDVKTAEFMVNTETIGRQAYPKPATFTDFGFIICYQGHYESKTKTGVFCQRYDNFAAKNGLEFRVNTTEMGNTNPLPVVASFSDNGFIVCFIDSSGLDTSSTGIFCQIYDNAASTVGSNFQVNTYFTNKQEDIGLGVFSDNGFVVTWWSFQDGSLSGVYAQLYDGSAGKVGSEFQVNTQTELHQNNPKVAVLSNDNFVITYQNEVKENLYQISAQRYEKSGTKIGTEFLVNSDATEENKLNPQIAAFADATFIIVWDSEGQDTSGKGIYAQRYDSSGAADGTETLVNTYTTSDQYQPEIAVLIDGSYIISWTSQQQVE